MRHQALMLKLKDEICIYLKAHEIEDSFEISQLQRDVFDFIAQETLNEKDIVTDQISAQNVVVEVRDEKTGQLYRRYLELLYDENHNGLRLTGENMSGTESQIAFLSDHAISKLAELRGDGPEGPQCHNDE